MNKYLKVRYTAEQRREQILMAGVELANEGKLYNMSMKNIADKAGCKRPTVHHYFKSLLKLRNCVIHVAIQQCHLRIIGQAIVKCDPEIKDCKLSLKNDALEWCAKND